MKRHARLLRIILVSLIGVAIIFFVVRSRTVRVSELFDASAVETITIQDYWAGFSILTPIRQDFTLETSKGSFTGEAQFSVGGGLDYEKVGHKQTEMLSIPVETIDAFLQELEQILLVEGEYQPFYQWTDDYPNIAIILKNGSDTFVIYTSSQGQTHVPWAATYHDREYIIYSDAPLSAYALLMPHLKKDVLNTLIDRVGDS